jgi:hypothetical protein
LGVSTRGSVHLHRGDGGFYQGFVVATGRFGLALVVLIFLIVQAFTGEYPQVGFLIALVGSVAIISGVHLYRIGRRVERLELRPTGLLRISYPLGQREFRTDDVEWVKIYPRHVRFAHAGSEYEIRGVESGLDALVGRLNELGVTVSDRRD